MLRAIYIFLLLTTLFSCGGESDKFLIGVSQCGDDSWREQINREMEQELSFYDKTSLEFRSASYNNETQIAQIKELIQMGIDLLIVAPNDTLILTPIIEEAYGSGIEVILLDNHIESDKYTAYLGVDNIEIGRLAAHYIASAHQATKSVIELTGNMRATAAQERHCGFRQIVDKYSNIEIHATANAHWSAQDAEQVVDSLLRIYPQTDFIFAQNDVMAAGAYNAAKKLSMEEQIKFIGVDALSGVGEGLDLIDSGVLDVSLLYPTFGNIIIKRANQIRHKREYPRETKFKTAIIDRVNSTIERLKIEQLRELDSRIDRLNSDISAQQRVNNMQRILLLFIIVAIIASVIFARVIRAKSKMNTKLIKANKELESQRDELLLARFNSYLKANLDNSELCADDISREMGYSTIQLYRKIKAITGESPTKCLRNMRLVRSRELLQTKSFTISEIAYQTGFSSPSYFTKCYKEHFGVLPSQ